LTSLPSRSFRVGGGACASFCRSVISMTTPSETYRRLSAPHPKPLLKESMPGWTESWECGSGADGSGWFKADALAIDALAPEWTELRERHLHQRLLHLGSASGVAAGNPNPALFQPWPAFGRRPIAAWASAFLVQLMGLLPFIAAIWWKWPQGGKTLTRAGCRPAGWRRRPCHIVTVNDYLVERTPNGCSLLFGVRIAGRMGGRTMAPPERIAGTRPTSLLTSKNCWPIFSATAALGGPLISVAPFAQFRPPGGARMGGRHAGIDTCIVDEADSVLIDEAVTPLIISAPARTSFWKRRCFPPGHRRVARVGGRLPP